MSRFNTEMKLNSQMFRGSFTALITPFKHGAVDERAFADFVEWQIMQGAHGLVPCGTTGESPTLTHAEHNRVIELCVQVAKKRVPVMAGTGSNATAEAISTTQFAEKVGADAALVVAPYYNKPTQEGLYQHFKAIHDATTIPIVLYNVPGRSIVDIKDETVLRLAELPRVVGIKDATGDLARPGNLFYALQKVRPDFTLISGEDATAVAFNAIGGQGCISVSANIAPKQCAAVQAACLTGDYQKAMVLQNQLMPLHKAMFVETSPGPVKYAASLLGKCSDALRLPLAPIAESSKQAVKAALQQTNIL